MVGYMQNIARCGMLVPSVVVCACVFILVRACCFPRPYYPPYTVRGGDNGALWLFPLLYGLHPAM